MMKNIMITLALCLCTATLFAQTKANSTVTPSAYTGSEARYSYNGSADDLRRKRAAEIRDVLWNSPEWKNEREAYTAEYHNTDTWKKHYASSVESLKILGDHPGPKEYAIWREVVSRDNAEMENSEAYKIYDAKLKDFNKRLNQEQMRRLAEEYPDPRNR